MLKSKYEPLWQDRDIRFDAPTSELSMRNGEKLIASWNKVEDTKGNTGEIGRLLISNLRLIWQSINRPRINLSIGLNCISTMSNRMMHTKLRGRNESLYMMTKVNGTRYEFIFIAIDQNNKQMVDLVAKVCKAYLQTKLFRDLRLRSSIMVPDQKLLKLLPTEQIYNCIMAVWNLSSDQGNLGTMYMTNVRLVWHANINQLFNISLPYIQIRNIKVRDSKFGLALVIESSESSGGYVLGFRLDPVEKLNAVFEEMNNLYTVHSNNPEFGVHHVLDLLPNDNDNADSNMDDNAAILMNNYQELIQQDTSMSTASGEGDGSSSGTRINSAYDPVLAYLAEGESAQHRPHQCTYDPSIGLSIENIKEGFTIDSLWQVVETVNVPSK